MNIRKKFNLNTCSLNSRVKAREGIIILLTVGIQTKIHLLIS